MVVYHAKPHVAEGYAGRSVEMRGVSPCVVSELLNIYKRSPPWADKKAIYRLNPRQENQTCRKAPRLYYAHLALAEKRIKGQRLGGSCVIKRKKLRSSKC